MAAARKTASAGRGASKAKAKAPKQPSKQSAANRKIEAAKRKARREEQAEAKRRGEEMALAKQGLTAAVQTVETAKMYVAIWREWACGMDYMTLADRHDLSKRRVEQIVSEMRGSHIADLKMDDPLFGMREAQSIVLMRKAAISEYAKLAEVAAQDAVKLGAMRDRDRAVDAYQEMLQELGLIPKHLGTLRTQEDFLALVNVLLEGMDELGISEEIQRALVERVEMSTRRGPGGKLQLALDAGSVDGDVEEAEVVDEAA